MGKLLEQVNEMLEWLNGDYDYERPQRGELRKGIVLKVEDQGVLLDVGFKADGFVPRRDIDRLGDELRDSLRPGLEVMVCVVKPHDREDELILSISQAQQQKDWVRAEEMLAQEEILHTEVKGYNKGGVIVQMGSLRGFVPASLLQQFPRRRLPADDRSEHLAEYVGQEVALKVIEVDQQRRRLVLSERDAKAELNAEAMETLMGDLEKGQIVEGTVSRLVDFGAFVDLGGADGLVHVSELDWRRVGHPSEVVQVGDKVQAYVTSVDRERQRISLSFKRLQTNPWERVYDEYAVGEVVPGRVTHVTDFGAFVELELGVEGLIHLTELTEPEPAHPRDVVNRGDEVQVRILRIDASRERIGLSLKQAPEQEEETPADEAVEEVPGEAAAADVSGNLDESAPEREAVEAAIDQDGYWLGLLEKQEVESQ
jgi:small subunit ribosomal protein S1